MAAKMCRITLFHAIKLSFAVTNKKKKGKEKENRQQEKINSKVDGTVSPLAANTIVKHGISLKPKQLYLILNNFTFKVIPHPAHYYGYLYTISYRELRGKHYMHCRIIITTK